MASVIQDFKFNKFSGLYGRFLVECEESDLVVTDIAASYAECPYIKNETFVSVEAPEHIAMLLKLAYGAYLVDRPPPKEWPFWDAQKVFLAPKVKYIKYRKPEPDYDFYIKDYMDILKWKDEE